MRPLSAVALPRGVVSEAVDRQIAGEGARSGVVDRQIAGEADNSGVPARRIGQPPDGVVRIRRGVETEETAATLGHRHSATSRGRRVLVGITSKVGRPCVSCCGPASARCTRC